MLEQSWPINFLHQKASWIRILLFGLLSLLFLPISLVGFLINWPPFFLSKYISKNIIKDPQFISSVKFVIGAILMPVYFLILAVISLIFIDVWQSLVLLFTLPMVSYFSYYSIKKLKSLMRRVGFKLSKAQKELSPIYLKINIDIENWLNY